MECHLYKLLQMLFLETLFKFDALKVKYVLSGKS